MDWRRTDQKNDVGACNEKSWRSIPAAVPDPAHLRIHDAISRRAAKWVAKQMGHSDWAMIARVYGRWILMRI
jgi:hypothetical protein